MSFSNESGATESHPPEQSPHPVTPTGESANTQGSDVTGQEAKDALFDSSSLRPSVVREGDSSLPGPSMPNDVPTQEPPDARATERKSSVEAIVDVLVDEVSLKAIRDSQEQTYVV